MAAALALGGLGGAGTAFAATGEHENASKVAAVLAAKVSPAQAIAAAGPPCSSKSAP
jgi:hypothetical protein